MFQNLSISEVMLLSKCGCNQFCRYLFNFLKQTHFWGLFSFTSNVNIWHNKQTFDRSGQAFASKEQSFIFGEWVDFVVKQYTLPTAFKYQRQIIFNIDLNIILNTRLLLTHTVNLIGKKKIAVKQLKKINSLIIHFCVINRN